MDRNQFITLLCGILLVACRPAANSETDQTVINGNSTIATTVSELFPHAAVIPFQTTSNGLIGIKAEYLQRLDDRLFLLNRMNSRNNLLCFDTTGRFLYVIDRMGHGPQEYTYLGDFLIDTATNTVTLTTEQGRYLVFDTAGNFLTSFRQQPPIYYDRQFVRTDDTTYVVYHNGDVPQGSDLLEADARTFNMRRSVPAADPIAGKGARPLSLWNGRLLYLHMNDTLYDATDIEHRQPVYYLDFGPIQRELIEEFRRLILEDSQKALRKLATSNEYIFPLSLFENDRWIAVSASKQRPGSESAAPRWASIFVLYEKNTGRSYTSEHLSWDILGTGPLENIEFVGCDDQGTLYAIWYDVPTEQQKRQIARSKHLSQTVKDQLLQLEEGDNPILFQLR